MYDTVIFFFFQFVQKLLQKKKKIGLPFRSVEFVLHNFVLN
jgi:hypothetical protein